MYIKKSVISSFKIISAEDARKGILNFIENKINIPIKEVIHSLNPEFGYEKPLVKNNELVPRT